jgi:hypothetical protein
MINHNAARAWRHCAISIALMPIVRKDSNHKSSTVAKIGEVAVAVLSKAKWVPQVSISHLGSLRFLLGSLCFTFSQRRDSSRKRIPS